MFLTCKALYGVVVHPRVYLRVFPTDDLVMDRPFDYAFDRFQAGRLDVGTVVVILHYAVDLTWCFVDTGYSWGWVRPNDVAVGGKDQIVKFAGEKPLIVSGDSVSFYYDNDFWQYAFELPMGAKLPLAGSIHGGYRVVCLAVTVTDACFLERVLCVPMRMYMKFIFPTR